MARSQMERFWDDRARESAFYFVDSRLAYRQPDERAFWAGGEAALTKLLTALDAPALGRHHVAVDIGCGLGRLTRPLAQRAGHVHAIDISSEMLTRARALNANLSNVKWIHGDGTSLRPIADGSADVCVSHVVFRHIPEARGVLAYVEEMGRVLRPGGFAVFEFDNGGAAHVQRYRGRFSRLAATVGMAPRGLEDPAWVGSSVALDDLRETAKAAGLDIARITGAGTSFCGVRCVRSGA